MATEQSKINQNQEPPMNIRDLRQSNYLTKSDVEPAILVTIKSCTQVNVAQEGQPADNKWALHFMETDKPMVLNSTNGQILAQITGSDESDGWNGKKVVLYNDPNITFGGKLVGGIRVRAPRNQPAAAKPSPPPAPEAVGGYQPGDEIDNPPF